MLSILKGKKPPKMPKSLKLKQVKVGLPKGVLSSVQKATKAPKETSFGKVSKKFDKKELLKKKLGAFS